MGLTIHYRYKAQFQRRVEVSRMLDRMRSVALDLPFAEVGEILPVPADEMIATQLIAHACEPDQCFIVKPKCGYMFSVDVGPGCEWLILGFARYPRFIDTDNTRVPTGLDGWGWQGFCKTQYASNPKYGGVANFLRCHVAAVTLLERIEDQLGLCMNIEDQGKWGRSYYSDDWREARAAGRKPTYSWHEPLHNLDALAQEVAEWNESMAALVNALSDAPGTGLKGIAPIRDFPDFEHLEAKSWRKGGSDNGSSA